jgi:hypothetical protein
VLVNSHYCCIDHLCLDWLYSQFGSITQYWLTTYVTLYQGSSKITPWGYLRGTPVHLLSIIIGNLRIMFDPNASMVAWLWLIICAGTLVITLIVSILTFNLLMFHIKLCKCWCLCENIVRDQPIENRFLVKRGMTTYNFIMGERAVVAATNAVDKQCCWRRKIHRRVQVTLELVLHSQRGNYFQSIQSTTMTVPTSVQPPPNMLRYICEHPVCKSGLILATNRQWWWKQCVVRSNHHHRRCRLAIKFQPTQRQSFGQVHP